MPIGLEGLTSRSEKPKEDFADALGVRVPGAMGGYLFTLEKSKINRFFKLENFQIM